MKTDILLHEKQNLEVHIINFKIAIGEVTLIKTVEPG